MASAEFHTTGLTRLQNTMRGNKQKKLGNADGSYKAVIVLLLAGGADTHFLMMPHSECV